MKKEKLKILFVCSFNQQRSPTAEKLFKNEYDTKSAGIYSEEKPVTRELLDWADQILVMEEEHKIDIIRNFPGYDYKITVLNIPDMYNYDNPELVRLLKKKVTEALKDRI